jgi:hypothetical protein
MIKRALIFVASMAVAAGIAWVGGYDFDRRGEDVAIALAQADAACGVSPGAMGSAAD